MTHDSDGHSDPRHDHDPRHDPSPRSAGCARSVSSSHLEKSLSINLSGGLTPGKPELTQSVTRVLKKDGLGCPSLTDTYRE
eukprot:3236799-Rhodomonas_salina.2